jgi:uncharacterized protein (DUF362 family)
MKPVVRIVDQRAYEPEEIRSRVRRLLEADDLRVRRKSVFLKPSFVYPARPPLNRGVNTQPEFVGGVVQALRDLGASDVWVGEDCLGGSSAVAFHAMGVLPWLKGAATPLFLDRERRVDVSVPDPFVEGRFRLPASLLNADLFISLPKLKVNMHSGLTLSAKNHMGLLIRSDRLTHHDFRLHQKIADLYRARVPDYVLADAIVSGEGQGPMHARPVETGVIVAGRTGVAVDAVSCRLMGLEPGAVPHLVHLHERGCGPIARADIEIDGEGLLGERARRFQPPRTGFSDCPPTMRFFVGARRACPEGCLGMIRGTVDHWARCNHWRPIRDVSFIVGEPHAEQPGGLPKNRTFVVGDCAAAWRDLGTFLPGCPVPPLSLLLALARKGIMSPLQTRASDVVIGQLRSLLPGWGGRTRRR